MRITLTTVLAVLLVFPHGSRCQDNKPDAKSPKPNETQRPSVWMKVKLKSTENVLLGLTLGDFGLIEENARRMNNFGRLEKLVHSSDESYQTQLKFFSHANEELMRQAKEKNLDGATLAFVQLTTSCVNCHRVVRDHKHDLVLPATEWTHVMKEDAPFYLSGPQQGRPADGQLVKGTKVQHVKDAGSYCSVLTEGGKTVYIACDAMTPIEDKTTEKKTSH